jgi:hypothetical protein
MALRNSQKSGEVMFTRCQTIDNQEEFSTADLKESGI